MLWQYGLWSFQEGSTKLGRFLQKNQHTHWKILNFEFWINGELSKIGHCFSNKVIWKLILSKNVNNKKYAPKSVFFNKKKKIEKDSDDFWHRKLTLKVHFSRFATSWQSPSMSSERSYHSKMINKEKHASLLEHNGLNSFYVEEFLFQISRIRILRKISKAYLIF